MRYLLYFTFILSISLLFTCNNDLCDDIICVNGGTCVNGVCDCPEGYEGGSCSQEVEPQTVIIRQILLTNFPATAQNGAGWDILSGADLTFAVVHENTGAVIYTHDQYFPDATGVVSFDNLSVSLNDPKNTRYVIRLLDYDDFDSPDYMGGVSGLFYTEGLNFPDKLDITVDDISLEVTIDYVF